MMPPEIYFLDHLSRPERQAVAEAIYGVGQAARLIIDLPGQKYRRR